MYKDMNLVSFVQRLLEKRAMQFYGTDDRYCLVDGKSGNSGWENVGTDRERQPLVSISRALFSKDWDWSVLVPTGTGQLFVLRRDQAVGHDNRFVPLGVHKRRLAGEPGRRHRRSRLHSAAWCRHGCRGNQVESYLRTRKNRDTIMLAFFLSDWRRPRSWSTRTSWSPTYRIISTTGWLNNF